MSMSGTAARDSAQTQTTPITSAITNSESVRSESQPQLEPWLMPSSRATSQPDSSSAPRES